MYRVALKPFTRTLIDSYFRIFDINFSLDGNLTSDIYIYIYFTKESTDLFLNEMSNRYH